METEEFLAVVSDRLDRMEREMVAALGPDECEERGEIARIVATLKSGILRFQHASSAAIA